MRHRTWLIAVALSFSWVSAFAAQAADCRDVSSKLLDNLDRANYAAAVGDFDDKMKALSPEKLETFWQKLPEKLGARGARDDARLMQKNGNDIVVTPIHFGAKVADAVVVCSPAGQIAGFHVFPQP